MADARRSRPLAAGAARSGVGRIRLPRPLPRSSCSVPLYWMFITSIKPSDDYLAVPPVWFPDEPTLVHYTAALFAYRGLQG